VFQVAGSGRLAFPKEARLEHVPFGLGSIRAGSLFDGQEAQGPAWVTPCACAIAHEAGRSALRSLPARRAPRQEEERQ